MLKKRAVPAKKLASVVGLITLCICALGRNFVKFMIGSVNWDLCSKVDMYGWKAYVQLSTESMRDLRYFRDNLSTLNGHEMVEGSETISFDQFFAGDASAIGGYLGDIPNNATLISFKFTCEEMLGSSTLRELLVLFKFYVLTDIQHLAGLNIVHFCDNKGVSSIMEKGSSKPVLHHLAREILISCRKHKIMLTVEWKSREDEVMQLVDLGSRGPWLILEDYQLDFISMSYIKSLFTFTVDAMASYRTRQCPRYYSASFELESEAVDFFAQHLYTDEFYWVMKIPIKYLSHKNPFSRIVGDPVVLIGQTLFLLFQKQNLS